MNDHFIEVIVILVSYLICIAMASAVALLAAHT